VLGERVSFVGRPGRKVERGLRVRGQDHERPAGLDSAHRPLRHREWQGTGKPARVDRRHNPIVAEPAYSLAVVYATGDPQRMYSGLSLLVSAAAESRRCAALLTFRALDLFEAADLERRAAESGDALLSPGGRDTFARSLVELRDTALALETIDIHACAASVETMLAETGLPVMSTPRFLRETAGAQLVFV
jgi:peroxiredoxin family protein